MGRALFSERFGSKAAPAIRVQPEAISPNPGKWSIYNRFDPDADEFFEGAVYEAFMDPADADSLDQPVTVSDSSSSESSSSSDSDSGRDSPILDLSSRPRISAIWDRLMDESATAVFEPAAEDDQLLADVPGYARADPEQPRVADDPTINVAVHATAEHPRSVPISITNSDTITEAATNIRISVPPLSIPVEPSTPSPASSVPPSTPPAVYSHLPSLMTPSPPPNVTPRIYVWGAHAQNPATSPGSPSVRHTHASARQSFPMRVRV